MQTKNEILFKTCKTCCELKDLTRFRPYARECKNCNNKKDAINHSIRNIKHYVDNKEQMKEENLLNYYKRKYDNKHLSMHEVKLFKISV